MRTHSTSPLALVLSPHSVPFSIDKIRSKPIHFCWKIVTMVTSVRRVCLSPSRTTPLLPHVTLGPDKLLAVPQPFPPDLQTSWLRV